MISLNTRKIEDSILVKAARTPEGFFAVYFIISEMIIALARFDNSAAFIANKIFMAVFIGYLVGVIFSLLPVIVSKILSILFTILFSLYLMVQVIYSSVFKNFWSFSATGGVADQALDFKRTILIAIKREIIPTLLILLLCIAVIICIVKWIDFSIHKWEMYFVSVFAVSVIVIYYINLLSIQGEEKNSPFDLLKNYSSIDMSIKKLGIIETMFRDGVYLAFEKSNTVSGKADTAFEAEKPKKEMQGSDANEKDVDKAVNNTVDSKTNDSDKNIDDSKDSSDKPARQLNVAQKPDYNLGKISDLTTNESVVELTEYINTVQPTYTNEYTGMFEGYNLIFIVAEAFDGYVLDRNLTPDLYKMCHEGFYFSNFYTPLWYGSTLGGEYADLTGLIPKGSGYLSMQKVGEQQNSMPFCLGNELADKGYKVYAYHNNEYDYYDRDLSREYIGYENYMGVGNGLEYEEEPYGGIMWPQSDLFMEQNTFAKYSGSEPFHVYYLTVSGHLNYNFGGNAMSEKNRDYVEDLNYSETTKAYIACQIEFEKMIEALNDDLEKKGIADKTLIVICGDHVPYDDMIIPSELAGRELDSFEEYKNSLIIYSASMEKSVKVDKPCYTPDILPTVLNLMGLEYDSRMLVGRDIMSDDPGLVIFPDSSFITDDYRYNAITGELSGSGSRSVSDNELETQRSVVSNRFRMSDAICELDYYSYVEKLMKGH
ncbi:MAG: LTA synthase family protein [Eubacterium sp.]|nr:LTA synthase family protein [Eubacterium sp.]